MRPTVVFHVNLGGRPGALRVGPGKIALLEAIEACGSISAAAKQLGMSYRRAWLLVDETNQCLHKPAVEAAAGGARGGGARLTPAGADLVRRYRAIESATADRVSKDLGGLLRARLRPPS